LNTIQLIAQGETKNSDFRMLLYEDRLAIPIASTAESLSAGIHQLKSHPALRKVRTTMFFPLFDSMDLFLIGAS
jgi:hypothetical protein